MIYQSRSPSHTKKFAYKLAQQYQQGIILLLSGELGAGKTTFVQGFAQGLGIKEKIISPTFMLIRTYPLGSQRNFYHIDLYRLEDLQKIQDLGLEEIFQHPGNIVIIEWGERLKNLPEREIVKINLEKISSSKRKITLEKLLA